IHRAMDTAEDKLHLSFDFERMVASGGRVVTKTRTATMGVTLGIMVRDQRQSASSFLDHASYMFCQHFPKVGPTQVEAAAEISKWHNDAGRHAGGHRDVYASIHATKRKGGSRMLCDVAAARQKGLWTLKCYGMEASMIH